MFFDFFIACPRLLHLLLLIIPLTLDGKTWQDNLEKIGENEPTSQPTSQTAIQLNSLSQIPFISNFHYLKLFLWSLKNSQYLP